MALQVKDLFFSYCDRIILKNVSLTIYKGEFIGIIGPNGSGKSTLLKNIYRALKPQKGTILLDGEDLYHIHAKKLPEKWESLAKKM